MTNINHFFAKLTLSFSALFFLSACDDLGGISSKFGSSSGKSGVEVAVLLPLNGDDSHLYQEVNQMIKMGLSDGAKIRLKVTSYDSSTRSALKESLERIAAEDTDIIIGPVYSEAAKQVASRFKNKDVTIISLSNNPVIAEENLYVFGHAPMRQLEFLVDQLLTEGYTNYIALLPGGRYSSTVSSILKQMIAARGATLARLEYYNDSEDDIARSMKVVSDSVDNLNEMDMNTTQPVVVLADDSATLGVVFNYAKQYSLDKKSLMAGDGRMNIDNSNLDIVYTGSNMSTDGFLAKKARRIGISHVGFMHEIAYDAGKMVAELIDKKYSYSTFSSNLKSANFSGYSGDIHFIDSIAQRRYDLIERKDGVLSQLGGINMGLSK